MNTDVSSRPRTARLEDLEQELRALREERLRHLERVELAELEVARRSARGERVGYAMLALSLVGLVVFVVLVALNPPRIPVERIEVPVPAMLPAAAPPPGEVAPSPAPEVPSEAPRPHGVRPRPTIEPTDSDRALHDLEEGGDDPLSGLELGGRPSGRGDRPR